jgi:hypothetical protein
VTHRTEANPPSPIEIATRDVLESIKNTATLYYSEHGVGAKQGATLPQFLRIVALYFHDKSLADWCHDLGIPDATDPKEAQP